MPKITQIDATARPQTTPEPARIIKAMTNANPINPTISAQSPQQPAPTAPEAAALGSERQDGKDEVNGEAKPLSPQYAALARKEAAMRTREKELQTKEASFKSQESEIAAMKAQIQKLKENPLEVLNSLGITYDQLVEQAVNQPNPELQSVQNEIKALKDAQKASEEASKSRESAQRDAAIKQIEHDVTDLVENNPEFSTVKEAGAASDVVELIVKTFDETGKLLTVDEAAQAIETELFEEAMKITGFSKVKAKLTPQVVEANKETVSKQQPIKTLTNTMSTTRALTHRERAILAFKGELK